MKKFFSLLLTASMMASSSAMPLMTVTAETAGTVAQTSEDEKNITAADSAIKDLAVFEEGEMMTLDDVIELSKKGSDLIWNDLAKFKGVIRGSGILILEYNLGNGYILHVGGMTPDGIDYARLFCLDKKYIDIRTDDVRQYIAEMSAIADSTSLNGTKDMTLDDVRKLAKKGDALDWADFKDFKGKDNGSGIYIWEFEIGDGFKLQVSGAKTDQKPESIILYHSDNIDGLTEMDIRTADVDTYLNYKRYTFNYIGSLSESTLKNLFAERDMTLDKGYSVWTQERVVSLMKNNEIKVVLKPDAHYVTPTGTEVINESTDKNELTKYDDSNMLQANYLASTLELPGFKIVLANPSAEIRTEENVKDNIIYRRYFQYGFASLYNDEETQTKLIANALNYIQLSPYYESVLLEPIAASDTNIANDQTMTVSVTEVKGDTLFVKSIDGKGDLMTLPTKYLDSDIQPVVGMKLKVTFSGGILETYPAQFGNVRKVTVVTEREEVSYKLITPPDKTVYKLGESINLKGIQVEVKKGDEKPVIYSYPDVAFDYDSNTPGTAAVLLNGAYKRDTVGTVAINVVASDDVLFNVEYVEDSTENTQEKSVMLLTESGYDGCYINLEFKSGTFSMSGSIYQSFAIFGKFERKGNDLYLYAENGSTEVYVLKREDDHFISQSDENGIKLTKGLVFSADNDAFWDKLTSTSESTVKGDANCDDELSMADAVLIMQSISNPDKYGEKGTDEHHITEQGKKNGDIAGENDGITNADALAIQKKLLKLD